MASDRDRQIYQLRHEQNISYRALGKDFGISPSRARQIFVREKEKLEVPKPIPKPILAKALSAHGLEDQSLADIKSLLQRLEDGFRSGWEEGFSRKGGRKARNEMKAFAELWGILPEPRPKENAPSPDPFPSAFLCLHIYTRLAVQRYTKKEAPSREDLQVMLQTLEDAGGWKAGFMQIEMGNLRSRNELEAFARRYDLLPETKNQAYP